MLGISISSRTAEGQPEGNTHQPKVGLYWLDDFKATSRLTINMGLRRDFFGHVSEVEGRLRTLSFAGGQANVVNAMLVPMLIPDPLDKNAELYDINWRQFMPRLGIAYRISDRTVLRTGAGLFYNAQRMNNFQILNLQPPFSGSNLFEKRSNKPASHHRQPVRGRIHAKPRGIADARQCAGGPQQPLHVSQ